MCSFSIYTSQIYIVLFNNEKTILIVTLQRLLVIVLFLTWKQEGIYHLKDMTRILLAQHSRNHHFSNGQTDTTCPAYVLLPSRCQCGLKWDLNKHLSKFYSGDWLGEAVPLPRSSNSVLLMGFALFRQNRGCFHTQTNQSNPCPSSMGVIIVNPENPGEEGSSSMNRTLDT